MANIWFGHLTALLFLTSGIVQAENPVKSNSQQSHNNKIQPHSTSDEEAKNSAIWTTSLSQNNHQRHRRMASEEAEEDEPASSYLRALSGEDEKRAKSSFRGDLGKRMQAISRGLTNEGGIQGLPSFWAEGKRFKVSSRFRGDLGKRARSSFRGDLGKRFGSSHSAADDEDDFADNEGSKFEFSESYKNGGGMQAEQVLDSVSHKDRGDSSFRPFLGLRRN